MTDNISKALLFSGQGSQYVGMLKDLYSKFHDAKKLIDSADDILEYKLSNICFDGPLETLKETRYTQPALFLHSSVIFELIKDNLDFSAVAGHSVGEYAALFSAGVLSFEDALKLVSLRGELMFKAGEKEPGTMFAVLGMDDAKLVELCEELTDTENRNIIVAANFNSPGQIVISGSAEYLRNNISIFKENGAKLVKELVVSGAFHSPLMQPAKSELEEAINAINFNNAIVPVYTNVYALPEKNSSKLKQALIEQLTAPVKWTQTVINMKESGITDFTEIGAGKVLQGLVKRTVNDVNISGYDTAIDLESILS